MLQRDVPCSVELLMRLKWHFLWIPTLKSVKDQVTVTSSQSTIDKIVNKFFCYTEKQYNFNILYQTKNDIFNPVLDTRRS